MTYRQIQRLYSDAFDEGFEFFAQKEFGLGSWIKKTLGIVTEKDLEDVKNKAEKEKESLEERARNIILKKQQNYNSLYGEYNDAKLAAAEAEGKAAGFEKRIKGLEEDLGKAKESARRWKRGAGIGAGALGVAGLGAYLYNRKKNKD